MEKTTHITIAKTEFNLTEPAYEKLRAYLESLKGYFSAEAEKSEIISDIESRIAEKLLEKKASVIHEADIESVIKEIGNASEFEAEEKTESTKADRVRKLYRDPDDEVIAGVASGIAHYFAIDPFIVRILFFISIFAGGTGVLIYLLMALFVPEAKTASQKLEMHGDKINLENIKQTVKERVSEVKKRNVFGKFFRFIGDVAQKIFKVFGKVFGFFLSLVSFISVLALTVGAAVVVANLDKPYVDLPLLQMTSHGLLWIGILAAYISLAIPLILLISLGLRILRRKQSLNSAVGFGLVGVWCLGIITAGVVGTRVAGDYYAYTSTHPEYQESSLMLDLPAFEKVNINDSSVTFRPGTSTSVSIEGRVMDLDNVDIQVVDGILSVSKVKQPEKCIFCDYPTPSVIITHPTITEIKIDQGSVLGEIVSENLTLLVQNAHINTAVEVETLLVNSENSYVELRGTSTAAEINLENTLLRARNFISDDLEINRGDSSWVEGSED